MRIKIMCPACDSIYEIEEPNPEEGYTLIVCPHCDSSLPIDARDYDITPFILESHKDEE